MRRLRFLIALLLAAESAGAGMTTYRDQWGKTTEALPQVLVRYKQGREPAAKSSLRSQGARMLRANRTTGVELLSVPAGKTLQSFVDSLKNNPDVEFAEPNGVYKKFDVPNDPNYAGSQYSLHPNYTNVESAWDITTGSPTVIVAVIDTGANLSHPDLVNQFWVNPNPSGNSGLHGTQMELDWGDGCGGPAHPQNGPPQCAGPTPEDDNTGEFHGTRVAGIIAAERNNNLHMAGVAPGVKIMVIKALNADGVGSFEAIADGVTYAVNNGATIINMSLGGSTSSDAVRLAVNHALSQNVVLVAAAGNSGNSVPVNFPAAISRVIAVGATDSTNTLAFFSCTGQALDLVAPGVGILSTIPPNTTSATGGDGTSFSAPMVSGVAALIRSLKPTMSVDQITQYINFTATDLGSIGLDTNYGYGLLNAYSALASAAAGTVITTNPSNPGESFPYPNPFYPAQGEVSFNIPQELGAQDLKITIFNVAGERVRTLNNTNKWNGQNDDGSTVASGLYYYFAKTSKGDTKGKVSVIK